MVKYQPITDIPAQQLFFHYNTDRVKFIKGGTMMHHAYIRGVIGLIWLVAAIVSKQSDNFELTIFYIILGGAFLYSAYAILKKEKNKDGE